MDARLRVISRLYVSEVFRQPSIKDEALGRQKIAVTAKEASWRPQTIKAERQRKVVKVLEPPWPSLYSSDFSE
ncbi:MAG: hypothetical protein L6R35_003301 [Caloplaca aegaea]|nr:MAG: hypothetical protein L6R35_003301 [Caloplaca aegaea]